MVWYRIRNNLLDKTNSSNMYYFRATTITQLHSVQYGDEN